MNTIKTEPVETKPDETDLDETKRNGARQIKRTPWDGETKPDETKPKRERKKVERRNVDPLFFEIPVPSPRVLDWVRGGLSEEWSMTVNPVSIRVSGDMVMIGVLPKEAE